MFKKKGSCQNFWASCSDVWKSHALLFWLGLSKAIDVKYVFINSHSICRWIFRATNIEVYLDKNESSNNSKKVLKYISNLQLFYVYLKWYWLFSNIFNFFSSHIFSMKFPEILFQNIFCFGCTVIFKRLTMQKSKLCLKSNHAVD